MTTHEDNSITITRPMLIIGACVLVALGAMGTALVTREGSDASAPPASAGTAGVDMSAASMAAPSGEVAVSLSPELIARAGIETTVAQMTTQVATPLRLPGIVEPNAYASVDVTPLVIGKVTAVTAELGDVVAEGDRLAVIFSPELAEAQTRYVSERARLAAHDRELERTGALVEIGAASREELERAHATHVAQVSSLEAAAARLELLGFARPAIDALESEGAVTSALTIDAPIDGIVTARTANVGLNVEETTTLFTIVDLSSVWVVADVYEQDLRRLLVGSPVTIRAAAYPGREWSGRVTYIDPTVNPDTRTVRVRAEVANPDRALKLGMLADVELRQGTAAPAATVPASAVQRIGDRTVVYLADASRPGTFIEREVQMTSAEGDSVAVIAGLAAGDVVVTEGSFFLRAERDRPGLGGDGTGGASAQAAGQGEPQRARVQITERGFEPDRTTVRARQPLALTFVRTTDNTCATEVVFPTLKERRALPLNQSVTVTFTPQQAGEIVYQCGMNMLRGAVVVTAE